MRWSTSFWNTPKKPCCSGTSIGLTDHGIHIAVVPAKFSSSVCRAPSDHFFCWRPEVCGTLEVRGANVCVTQLRKPCRTTIVAGARECRGSRELGVLGHVQHAGCKAHGEQQNSPGGRESARDLIEVIAVHCSAVRCEEIWHSVIPVFGAGRGDLVSITLGRP